MTERPINRKAFVSHAHADHAKAKTLAEALRERGVESWLDEWEIQPGDSLVQKIFAEGLRECGVFLVLLSPASAASRWVREELDVALIRRIEGTARVIPIIVEQCEIPTALKALMWIDLNAGVDTAAHRIAEVVFELRTVPPVAPPPSSLSFSIPGLTPLAARVGLHLFGGPDGPPWDPPQFHARQLATALSLTPQQINDAIDELADDELIKVIRPMGSMPFNFAIAMPSYRLALRLRGTSAIGYDPEADIKAIANAVAAQEVTNGERLAEATGLPESRINAAVQYLEDGQLVKVYRAMGGGPFTFIQANATAATRRFVAINSQ
jgi:hypothetical protein